MINLHDYNLVIINSSAGKDSLCAIWEMCRIAEQQQYPKAKMVVSHQDLGDMEWPDVKRVAEQQAKLFGLEFYFSKYRNNEGKNLTLLQYVAKRGKWPSSKQRYCTSDFKRGPGARVLRTLTKDLGDRSENYKVLYVFGFRKAESPARAKRPVLSINKQLTTKTRLVHDYLPIHDWSTERVWKTIKLYNLPYHYAYRLGMPRLSCVFCIFSPFDALVLAGKTNPRLLDEYVEVEKQIGHQFKMAHSIEAVQKAIEAGYQPKTITDWVM